MAVGIRTTATQTNSGSSATVSVTTDATPEVGDVVFAIHANDYYAESDMPAPTGGPGGWAEVTAARGDAGSPGAHIKVWWAEVVSAGAMTVSVTETGSANEEKCLALWVLSGVDTTSPVDAAAGGSGSGTSVVAPSCSPTEDDSYLICVAESGGGSSTPSFTPPGSMTERYELQQGGLSNTAAFEQLVASGATGTRTFTAASAIPYAVSSFAVRAATGGVARDLDGSVDAAASATGSLTAERSLIGQAVASAALNGSLVAARSLDGVSAASASATSELTRSVGFDGAVTGAAGAAGAVIVARALAGGVVAVAALTGSLTVSGAGHDIDLVASLAPRRWVATLEAQ